MPISSSENDELWDENNKNVTIDNKYNLLKSMKIENYFSKNENLSENLSEDNDSSSENENLSSDNIYFGYNAANILQELYSDDELLSNFDDVNLAESKNI